MMGIPPVPVAAPAPSLARYRWWYIAPGRLFGLLVDENGHPLETAHGTLNGPPATAAEGEPQDAERPAWCPADDTGTCGYSIAYAPFPLSLDQLRALMPQPFEPGFGPTEYAAETGEAAIAPQQTSSVSPPLREEVDLGVQLQFPVCSFLDEAREDLRLHTSFAAQGHMILTRIGNRIGVSTTVKNLLPLLDPLPPGLYFYEAWLERVDEDGVVRAAVPAGVISVSEDGTGCGFRELDAENVDGSGLPIETFNGTSITAQARDGVPGQSEYAILEGTLPRTVKW